MHILTDAASVPGLQPAPGGPTLAGPLAAAPRPQPAAPSARPARGRNPILRRRQTVAPLPGGLDRVPMINDNNPELIKGPGILLLQLRWQGYGACHSAHLNGPCRGASTCSAITSTPGPPKASTPPSGWRCWRHPGEDRPVRLTVLEGSTALSQSLDSSQPSAPFLPCRPCSPRGATPVFPAPAAGWPPNCCGASAVPCLPEGWSLPPGRPTTLLVLPLPVRGLDPLLNGRNLQMRLRSDGPVDVATLAAFGPVDRPPDPAVWSGLLEGP